MTQFMVTVFSVIYVVVVAFGIGAAVHAIMTARTSQGSIAWVIALISFPLVAAPLYLVFGRSKFRGYVKARREDRSELAHLLEGLRRQAREQQLISVDGHPEHEVLETLAKMRFSRKNQVDLLVDGQATFDAIFQAVDSAREYILVEFFIIKDDAVGEELKEKLIAKAKAGVRVYLLYDEIGSHKLSRHYTAKLREAGADVRAFHTTRGRANRFQINFRNHRKIVIVDGVVAFVGGLNVGDEYLGRSARFGHWRDTHLRLTGPCVQATQVVFVEDWYWATSSIPELNWTPRAASEDGYQVLILPTGPADRLETCGMFFVHAINSATDRLWIASPYFVPDMHVITALQLASMRGVDVRIMLPEKPDHVLVYLSAFSFLEEMEQVGVGIFRYQKGFLHQKALLVDDRLAAVGTANLDNRSFRLNFEITAVVDDHRFAAQVENMFDQDFERCRLATSADLIDRPFWFKVAVRVARLMAPIQ